MALMFSGERSEKKVYQLREKHAIAAEEKQNIVEIYINTVEIYINIVGVLIIVPSKE